MKTDNTHSCYEFILQFKTLTISCVHLNTGRPSACDWQFSNCTANLFSSSSDNSPHLFFRLNTTCTHTKNNNKNTYYWYPYISSHVFIVSKLDIFPLISSSVLYYYYYYYQYWWTDSGNIGHRDVKHIMTLLI